MSEAEKEAMLPLAAEEVTLWYHRRLVMILGLLCLGPLALPLVWIQPRLKWYWKLYLTIAVIGLASACMVLIKLLLQHLQKLTEIT